MNRTAGLTLVVIGIVLLLAGLVEHVALRVEMIPHLAIILGVIAVLLIAAGVYGLMSQKQKAA